MNKTGIEYGDYGWNFYPGCLHKPQGICHVANCWAKGMTQRQRKDFYNPQLIPEKLLEPLSLKKPSRILVNFMGDLFGDWVDPDRRLVLPPEQSSEWIDTVSLKNYVYQVIEHCPQHTFLFLTKNPSGLLKWGKFPDNCWVGVSATDQEKLYWAIQGLVQIEAKVKYLSLEPLLAWVSPTGWLIKGLSRYLKWGGISWVILGSQTKPTIRPKIEWVTEIVAACKKAGIPVFLKDNLNPIFADNSCKLFTEYRDVLFTFKDFLSDGKISWHLKQEMPR